MNIFDVLTSEWAMVPGKLTEIRSIYNTHLKGQKIDLEKIKEIEAKIGAPLQRGEQGYEVINGVAVIPITGIIAQKMNMLTKVSGGSSSELAMRDIKAALNDESVKSILLDINSPGGTVDGTFEIANYIFNSRGIKPIVAFTDGMMASAAYWIGAATDKIYISGNTVKVGSIGVVGTHLDISKAEEKAGHKTTEITAGKYKSIVSEYSPLSKDGRESIQESVDYLYSVFVSDIAKFRNVSTETVLEKMADGKIFIGESAITAGLADGVSTKDQLLLNMADGVSVSNTGGVPITNNDSERIVMENSTQETIFNNLPIEKKSKILWDKDSSLRAEFGEFEVFLAYQRACVDGKVQITQNPELSKIVDQPPDNLSVEEKAKAVWSKDAKLQAEFGGDFEAYLAYETACANGQVKILGTKVA